MSHINVALGEVTTTKFANVPITACVTNHLACPNIRDSYVTLGAGSASALAFYSYYACLWSWLPGDVFDTASNCGEGLPDLGVSDVHGTEGDSGTRTFEFVVALSAPSPAPVTVHYRTRGSTFDSGLRATPGQDYEAIADQTLTFAAFETRKTVAVAVKGDTMAEREEWFALELFSATGATAVDFRGTGRILPDDVTYLSIGDVTKAEGHSGSTAFTFPVTLAAPSAESISVHARTRNGTAIAGSDYTAVVDTLVTFAPGQISRNVTVQVTGDPALESDETFVVFLVQATGAAIDRSEAVGTIKSDDAPAKLVAPAGQAANEGAGIALKLGTLMDPRPAGPWAISVKWGDAQAETFSVSAAGKPGSHARLRRQRQLFGDRHRRRRRERRLEHHHVRRHRREREPDGDARETAVRSPPAVPPPSASPAPSIPSSADTAAGWRYAFSCTNASLATATYAGSSSDRFDVVCLRQGRRLPRACASHRQGRVMLLAVGEQTNRSPVCA